MKKNIKVLRKRGFALFLALAMCMSSMQITAFAAEEDEATSVIEEVSTPSEDVTVTVTVEQDDSNHVDVDVSVEDRPSVDPGNVDEVQYTGSGSADLNDTSNGTDESENTGDEGSSGEDGTVVDSEETASNTDEDSNNVGETGSTEENSAESGNEDSNKVTVEVEGSETFTPNEEGTKTDDQERLTNESGTINGEEEEKITIPETDVTPDDKKNLPSEEVKDQPYDNVDKDQKVEFTFDGENGFQTDNNGSDKTETKEQEDKTSEISADISKLVDLLKPTEPGKDGFIKGENDKYTKSEPETEKDGVKTTVTTEWEVKNPDDGSAGWQTVETVTTVEKGSLENEAFGWNPPEGAEKNEEDGSYKLTETKTGDDGVTITTITVFYPATGEYERTTTTVTKETVTFTEGEEKGTITVTGVKASIGDGNAELKDVVSLAPTDKVMAIGPTNQNGMSYNTNTGKWSYKGSTWLTNHLMKPFSGTGTNQEELTYTESALRSTLFINLANGKKLDGQATIRKLENTDGSVVYVYCAQHEKTDKKNTGYDIVNVPDADFFELTEDEAKHIQFIAENGYWGTESGVGSLTEVRSLIGERGKYITDGIALAVTQAAIWYYGNEDKAEMFEKNGELINIFETCYTRATPSGNHSVIGALDKVEQEAAMALFEALIRKDDKIEDTDIKSTTDIISQEDIKGTSISVEGKVTEEELTKLVKELEEQSKAQTGEEQTKLLEKLAVVNNNIANISKYKENNITEDRLYETNLSLTVAVVPERINAENGQMTVYVYVDGIDGPVAQKVLPIVSEGTEKDNNGNIIVNIPGVVLPKGVGITLNLQGTQKLAEGAYLFRSDIDYSKSQAMVGYVKGESSARKVDLNVNMQFDVTDPEVTKDTEVKVTQTVSEKRNWEWSSDWERNYVYNDEDPEEPETPNNPGNPDNPTTSDYFEDSYVPRTSRTTTAAATNIPDVAVPLANIPDTEVPLVSIMDEEVPLASVPRTGDNSQIWALLTLFSGLGLAWLALDGKKRGENAK